MTRTNGNECCRKNVHKQMWLIRKSKKEELMHQKDKENHSEQTMLKPVNGPSIVMHSFKELAPSQLLKEKRQDYSEV